MSLEVINKLKFDKATGLHSIVEAGFKYEFPQSLLSNFKLYIFRFDFVSRWYRHLNDEDRVKVNKSNAYE